MLHLKPKIALSMLGNPNLNNLYLPPTVDPTYHLFVEFEIQTKGGDLGPHRRPSGEATKCLAALLRDVSTSQHLDMGRDFAERPRGGEPQNMTLNMNLWTRCISCCEEIQRHIHFFDWLGICYKLRCSMDQLSVPLESPCGMERVAIFTNSFVRFKNATKQFGRNLRQLWCLKLFWKSIPSDICSNWDMNISHMEFTF